MCGVNETSGYVAIEATNIKATKIVVVYFIVVAMAACVLTFPCMHCFRILIGYKGFDDPQACYWIYYFQFCCLICAFFVAPILLKSQLA